MRWYSTPQSSVNGEVTRLAIAECLASIAVYVVIGVYVGTFKSLAWAVAVAPMMLLRTDNSVRLGLSLFKRFQDWGVDWIDSTGEPSLIRAMVMFIAWPAAAILIRLWSTISWAIRQPACALRQMPSNWIRQSLCTDLAHPPEILPGESGEKDYYVFAAITEAVRERRTMSVARRVGTVLLLLPYLLVGYLPSLLYRLSFKATSLAYAPFVWVAQTTLLTQLSTKIRLERFTKGELEKARRWFSASVLSILACKFGIMLGWVPFGQLLSQLPSRQLIERFVQPSHLPWWQITLLIDALLTYLLLWFADAALGRLDDANPWPEGLVVEALSIGSFVRSGLSILTMSHFCLVAIIKVTPSWIKAALLLRS